MDTYIDRIKYNYYPIECTNSRNIKRNNPKIITTYQGKINQPNIYMQINIKKLHIKPRNCLFMVKYMIYIQQTKIFKMVK